MKKVIEFSKSGLYTLKVPDNVTSIECEIVGGGGGGGKSLADYKQTGGGGGEAGEYKKLNMTVTPGQILEIIIGQGGLSGQAGTHSLIKNLSSEQVLVESYGGSPGKDAKPNIPGPGGITSIPLLTANNIFASKVKNPIVNLANSFGNGSSGSVADRDSKFNGLAIGGNGGATPFGGGGAGGGCFIKSTNEINQNLIGEDGIHAGTGGGGAAAVISEKGTTINGGRGADGYVKFTYIQPSDNT